MAVIILETIESLGIGRGRRRDSAGEAILLYVHRRRLSRGVIMVYVDSLRIMM